MLNPRPVRHVKLNTHDGLSVGDRVVAIGLCSRVHGIGTIAAIRTVSNIKLAAVKFESSYAAEFTELQLRKVS